MNTIIVRKSFKILFSNKLTFRLFLLSVLLILIVFFAFIHTKALVVFPTKEQSLLIPHDDRINGGKSKIEHTIKTDSALTIQYTLNKGFISPYAGIVFNYNTHEKDISKYDRFHIEVKGKGLDNIYVFLLTHDNNVKDSSFRLANRHSSVNLALKQDKSIYNVPLDDFSTPAWWYEAVQQPAVDFGPIELNRLRGISITTGISPVIGQPQELTIQSIRFYKDYSSFFIIAVCFEALLLLALYMYYFFQLKGDVKPLEVIYKPTTSPEELPESDSRFLNYIHTNYHEPDLSLSKVSENSGVSERVISKTISDQFQCNFKTYVNRIRIEEAQRLLKNSNLNISEIAYKVGFNSPSTFTKVFKKLTGNAPSSSKTID